MTRPERDAARGRASRLRRSLPGRTVLKVSLRLALILMTLSLFLCRDVASPEGMAAVPLGLPIPFVVVDATGYARAPFPRCVRFGDPKRHPTRLRPLAALADLALLMLALVVLARVLGLDRRRPR